MLGVFQLIRKVAPLNSTVLIKGETGTGKELVARAIHANSRRSGQQQSQPAQKTKSLLLHNPPFGVVGESGICSNPSTREYSL
jgi:Sigma-54 interaction domain